MLLFISSNFHILLCFTYLQNSYVPKWSICHSSFKKTEDLSYFVAIRAAVSFCETEASFICYMVLKHGKKQETKHFILISNDFFLYFTSIHIALLEIMLHVNSETMLKQRRSSSVTMFVWSFKLACLTSFPPFSGYFPQAHWLQNWCSRCDLSSASWVQWLAVKPNSK